MAFGVGTPADDWTQDYNDFHENKSTNASLPSNQLVNHGTYCRRFAVNGDYKTIYRLTDSSDSIRNALVKSVRAFTYNELLTSSAYMSGFSGIIPFIGINGTMDAGTGKLSLSGSASSYFLSVFREDYGDDSTVAVQLFQGFPHTGYSRVYSDYIGTGIALNKDWIGLRLDASKIDQDLRLEGYVAIGHTVCDTLDAQGEPVWTKVIDVTHRNGTNIPAVALGNLKNNFANSTPAFTGETFFGAFSSNADYDYYTYIDSVSCKKI